MSKIFLSYAEEDSKVASEIVRKFQEAGQEVFYWEEPLERGGRFINWIEKKIPAADFFLALLSKAFLASGYCQHEKEIAIQLEKNRSSHLIYVILLEPVDLEKAGFLGTFDQFDLTGTERENELQSLIRIVERDTKGMVPKKADDKHPYKPDFQNREEELDEILSNLTKPTGGVHFWQLLAPPQMGKSWFMTRLADDLQKKNSQHWEIRQVSLRAANSLALRSDKTALLSKFFGSKISNPINEKAIIKIARQISRSEKFWLLLLDNAELLSDKTAVGLRETLSKIDMQLRNHEKVRLAFVAATRRHFGAWIRVLPEYPRFKSRTLSPFTVNVVFTTLKKMTVQDGINEGQGWLDETAKLLQRVSEGLPALLVLYLDWIKKQAYMFDPDDIESQTLFTALARPYIEETILSPDSLLPGERDANRIQPQCEALITALSGLCLNRRFIARYITDWMQGNVRLSDNMRKLGWETSNLHNALKRTYITEPVPNDLWTVFYPAIRRLLFRYFYETLPEQATAHHKASLFYQNRWHEWDGTDKAIVLLENLWHQIEYQRLSAADELVAGILQFTKSVFESGLKSNLYSPQELAEIIKTRISEDEEFQNTAHQITPQLSNKLLDLL